MSDPTPTPTPREVRPVTDQRISDLLQHAERELNDADGATRLPRVSLLLDEAVSVLREVRHYRAALAATGDAPPAREIIDAIELPDFTSPEDLHRAAKRLLTAYTALAAQCAAVRAERDALREALERFIDGEECRFDHHGYCQTHTSLEEGPCLMVRARAALATPARPTDTGRDG